MPLPIRRWPVTTAALCLVLVGTATSVGAQSSESIEYFHTDAIGSIRMVTGPTGEVLERRDFLPFGEELAPPPNAQPLGFGGAERDAETANSSSLGLSYFGARHLHSGSGRFTAVDPGYANGTVGSPQSWNGYAYGNNNPLRFVDPTGRASETVGSEDPYRHSEPCPGWLIVADTPGCGWNEGLLTFDADGWLIDDFVGFGDGANWLRRRGTAPVSAADIAAMRQNVSAAALNPAMVQRCTAANAAEASRVSGMNVTPAHATSSFLSNGALNVIFEVPGGAPSALPMGARYAGPGPWIVSSFLGLSPSLHVAPNTRPGHRYGYDQQASVFTFTTHIDTAKSPSVLGSFVHFFVDYMPSMWFGIDIRPPC